MFFLILCICISFHSLQHLLTLENNYKLVCIQTTTSISFTTRQTASHGPCFVRSTYYYYRLPHTSSTTTYNCWYFGNLLFLLTASNNCYACHYTNLVFMLYIYISTTRVSFLLLSNSKALSLAYANIHTLCT